MLTWWRSFSSCFLVNFPISIVTISIWRSLWRSAFLIYEGAWTIFLSTLFWNRWIMSLLLCFVHPHSWMPQVHAGFNISLYSVTLLCIDRADQLIVYRQGRSGNCVSTGPIFFPWAITFCCILVQAVRVFFLTCAFQRNLSSSVMPRLFLFVCWQKLCMGLQFSLHYARIIVRHLRSPVIFGEKLIFFSFLSIFPSLASVVDPNISFSTPSHCSSIRKWESERERFTRAQNTRSKCYFVFLRFLGTPDDKKM